MKVWIIYTYNGGISAIENSRRKAVKTARTLSKLQVEPFTYDIKAALIDLNDYIDASDNTSSIRPAFWFVNGKRYNRA